MADESRTRIFGLLSILLIAAALRLIRPLHSPPGLQVDEASNVWNAACIGQLGVDEHGKLIPIFTTAEFGSYRSPLFLYFIVPFQWLLGVNAWSARLAPALAGVASVWLIESIGRRWFGATVGLTAAALMAIDPWHLQLSRWAHEASICPLLVLLPIALATSVARRPRPGLGFTAGFLAGGACYGYAAVRLFLPLLIVLTVIAIGRPAWRDWLRKPGAPKALRFWMFGFLLAFGPLVIRHLTDPHINARARDTWVWQANDSAVVRIEKVAARYLPHFDPIGMSLKSPIDPSQATPRGFGLLGWYIWPLAIVGAVVLLRSRRSIPARIVLIAVLVYPAGDLLSTHQGVNALRSFPGAWSLLLLAAAGAGALIHRHRLAAWLALPVLFTSGLHLNRFFGEFDRSATQYETRNLNILQACDWLRPRQDQFDGIFWTQTDFSFIYPVTALGLGVSPQEWFAGPIERFDSVGERYPHADLVHRYRNNFFLYDPGDALKARAERMSEQPVRRFAIVMRPKDVEQDHPFGDTPAAEIYDPQGKPSLLIYVLSP